MAPPEWVHRLSGAAAGRLVEVEVDLAPGFPRFAAVGLPDNIVTESNDRVKAAIQNSGYPFPFERVAVNLAPVALKKEGAGFDLPIAVGILAALGIVNSDKAARMIFCGELSLDGRVKPVAGCQPMAIQARDCVCSDIVLSLWNCTEQAGAYNSWRVGRNRISFTSTSSGWLMAKATARANESAGIAISS